MLQTNEKIEKLIKIQYVCQGGHDLRPWPPPFCVKSVGPEAGGRWGLQYKPTNSQITGFKMTQDMWQKTRAFAPKKWFTSHTKRLNEFSVRGLSILSVSQVEKDGWYTRIIVRKIPTRDSTNLLPGQSVMCDPRVRLLNPLILGLMLYKLWVASQRTYTDTQDTNCQMKTHHEKNQSQQIF